MRRVFEFEMEFVIGMLIFGRIDVMRTSNQAILSLQGGNYCCEQLHSVVRGEILLSVLLSDLDFREFASEDSVKIISQLRATL